jgi:hypothetical protein
MARDSRMMSQPAFAEGQMQAAPNLSPAQLFESARRAAQDGQLALAEQFLRHILAVAPGSPEGAAAQTELRSSRRSQPKCRNRSCHRLNHNNT